MLTKLTTIFTGSYKIIAPLHHYNKETAKEDVVIIVTKPYDTIHYIAIDNVKETILHNKPLGCIDAIKRTVTTYNNKIKSAALIVDNVFGIYSYINNNRVATVFVLLKNKYNNANYLVQTDIVNDNINNIRVQGITKFFDKNHKYFDTTVTTNVTISDTQSVSDIDAYITYINMDGRTDLKSADIQGIPVLVTQEEKNSYYTKYGLTPETSVYPLVDTESTVYRQFFKLTDDTNRVRLNFSTGLGFIGFEE